MIVIFGASGNTGGVVAEHLLAAARPIRVVGRNAERLAPFTTRGAQAAVGDVTDHRFVAETLDGAAAAYAMVPPQYQHEDPLGYYDQVSTALAEGLRAAGVRKVVALSSLGADLPAGTGPIAGLHAQEERLREIPGLDLLFLRPSFFFENHFATLDLIRHQGINADSLAADLPVPQVAAADVGKAAAQALLAQDFHGVQVRELLGPRDLSMAEATRILGELIGKPDLPYVQLSYADHEQALTGAGFSARMAKLMVEMARAINEQRVRPLHGRTPENTTETRFEDFARELARAYQG
jgi:uncharacterized protein YbjT (DUF2867 family)